MKIAIASNGDLVSEHFGHCEGFKIYEYDEKTILGNKFVENPGHRPGFLPVFLSDLGVKCIISGGMGETAQDLFKEHGIKVIVGASGICDEVIKMYVNDQLKSTDSVCREHQHEGECGN